jgi:2,3-dihydroxybenzoate decarboxylase
MQGKITLEEHFSLIETPNDMSRFSIPGAGADLKKRLLDIHDIRLKEMDEYGIELAIQSLNAPGVQAVPNVDDAIALAQRANDFLAEAIVKRPDRLAGFAALPLQDPEAACVELMRCVNELGFKGALVNGFTTKGDPETVIYYDLPEYRPFWSCVQDLGMPFYMHPRNPIRSRLQSYDGHPWFENSPWAFAVETALHTLRLLASGLFDEYPGVQLIVGHLGERIPYDMWRLDNRIKKSPQGIPAKKTISEYMRSNVHLTTSGNFNDPTLHCAMAEVGVDRIMFSVDYPFETTADAAIWFDNSNISESEKMEIGRENAIKLFKLDMK